MAKKSKYTTLINDTLIFALGNIGSKVIIFFLVPFYTYYLTPEEYGISDLIFTISQLAIPFFSLVIFDAVIRFALYRKEQPQDVLLVGIIVWLVGSVLAFSCMPLFGLYKTIYPWKWYVAVYISVNMLVSVGLNYLKAIDKNLIYSIICILQTLALALLNILLVAHLQLGIEGYLISCIGSNIIAMVLVFLAGHLVKELLRAHFDKELAKQMIAYSAPLILNNLSWWVIQSSNKLMLETMVSATALGIYTVASRIPSLITVFITIFQQAWGISSVKEMDSTNDSSFYTNVFTFYSFIAFLGGMLLCTLIKPFMEVYVQSNSYGDVWRYVPLLLASAVFSALVAYCGSMYGALKKSVNNMISTLIAAIINIFVSYFCILTYGLWGALIGTVTAYFVLAFIRMMDIKRYVNISFKWKTLCINSVLIFVQALILSISTFEVGVIFSVILILAFVLVNKTEVLYMYNRISFWRQKHV